MAFRCIMVENPARLSVRNHQLVIRTQEEHTVPLEDISALLLENQQITVTAAALAQLGQCGCAVFVCDEKHLPCAVQQPYMQHSRQPAVIREQLTMSAPQKKRLWQSIVRKKITNQGKCLELAGFGAPGKKMREMANKVRSGDADNMEAVAAQFYFPSLFGEGFVRGEDNGINAALNYGYAVLRGSIARALAVYGFLPAVGLHHCSTLNAFNLADDLIEPFRPVADLLVFRNMREEEALTSAKKRQLFNALNLDILSGEQHHSVAYAVERLVQSLSRVIKEGAGTMCLPELLEPKQHCYE